jgi:hypothetical protein
MTIVAFVSTDANAAEFVPSLGAASPYAVLGAASSTGAGLSDISGEIGLTSSVSASSGLLGTGLLSGTGSLTQSLLSSVTGATTTDSTATATAVSAAAGAFHAVAADSPTHVLSGDVLHGLTLTPGVYAVSGSLELAGRLILDARGARNADFIFQIPSNLSTASGAEVILGAGVEASNILWQVGGGTDLAPNTSFVGTILSNGPITLGSGSKLVGRALSLTSAVNLTNDSIALPIVGAAVSAAGTAARVTVPTTSVRAAKHVSAASPSIDAGARVGLPLPSLDALHASTRTLTKVPAVGAFIRALSGVGAGLSSGLPFTPLQGIGVPALAVPVQSLPTIPIAGLSLPVVSVPTATLPTPPSTATQAGGLPFIPLQGIGVPALAVPVQSLPTIPIAGLTLPAVSAPTAALPTAPSSASPIVPELSTLPLPLSEISLPQLGAPLASTPSSTALPQLTLPTVTLPSISSGGLSLPKVSLTPPTSSAGGKIVHPRVKEGSSPRSSSRPHAKSTTGSAPGSSSTIPVGAPETGFGGMAGSDPRLMLSVGALLLALCAGTLALRSRRVQHG